MSFNHYFHDDTALLERLSRGLIKRRQEVVFLLGSALSMPMSAEAPGVPGVDGVIKLIQREFDEDDVQLEKFQHALASGVDRYQAAFVFLQGRCGHTAVQIRAKRV